MLLISAAFLVLCFTILFFFCCAFCSCLSICFLFCSSWSILACCLLTLSWELWFWASSSLFLPSFDVYSSCSLSSSVIVVFQPLISWLSGLSSLGVSTFLVYATDTCAFSISSLVAMGSSLLLTELWSLTCGYYCSIENSLEVRSCLPRPSCVWSTRSSWFLILSDSSFRMLVSLSSSSICDSSWLILDLMSFVC
jgi:hypothetical protein